MVGSVTHCPALPETEECLSSTLASVFSLTPYNIVSFFLLPLVCSFPFGHHLWCINASSAWLIPNLYL